jgi:putative hydrolase of the HAD superfamily
MPGTAVRAIFFDAVGTLIHPQPAAPAVYAAIGARFGSRLDAGLIAQRFRTAFANEEALDRAEGLQTSEAREVLRWRRIVAAVLDDTSDREGCFQELFTHFSRPQAWRCEPGTAAVLRQLGERGSMLGIASNYDSRLRSVAAGLDALTPARHLVISSEVGWRKPAPAFFEALCRTAGMRAEEILFVGDDRTNDFDGARAFGLPAVLFDPRSRERDLSGPRIACLEQLLEQPAVREHKRERLC